MKRTIIKINEEKCNGCGMCVAGCHEGALQIIDGKARLISELFCDGLGACIGECPEGAIELEEREAEPYDELKTLRRIMEKGRNTVLAHLKHLKDYGEVKYLNQAINYLQEIGYDLNLSEITSNNTRCNCIGSREVIVDREKDYIEVDDRQIKSQLRQWPIQLHLINPSANYFYKSDLLISADCVPFAYANFHNNILKGKIMIIACPKLDVNKESYIDKLAYIVDNSNINTITIAIMEVPCCSGLIQIVKLAMAKTSKKIPVKIIIISIKGEIISEEWLNI